MKNHLGEEILFGRRVAYGAQRREATPNVMPEIAADAAALRLRIQQAATSDDAGQTRHVGLLAFAIAAPVSASLIGALLFSIG